MPAVSFYKPVYLIHGEWLSSVFRGKTQTRGTLVCVPPRAKLRPEPNLGKSCLQYSIKVCSMMDVVLMKHLITYWLLCQYLIIYIIKTVSSCCTKIRFDKSIKSSAKIKSDRLQ